MKKALIIIPIVLLLLIVILITYRVKKDIKKKLQYTNTFAIQNIQTGKAIRVHDADYHDKAETILYTLHNWECMTWEIIQLEDSTYLLKNLYTQKTFEPVSAPKSGVSLWQKPLGGSKLQYWEIIKQPDETYLIRLKGTEMYITITSDKDNSSIVLMPKQNSSNQYWTLVKQNPIF